MEKMRTGECGRRSHTLVDISLSVVRGLILLVNESVLAGGQTGAEACVVVLGDRLVGLLGSFGTSALDGLRHVVCGVLVSMLALSVEEDLVSAEGGERPTLMVSILICLGLFIWFVW